MTLQNRISFFFCLLTALIPLLAVDMPRGLALMPGVLGIIFYTLYCFAFDTKPVFSWKTGLFVLAIFMLSGFSLIWALHFDVSLKQVFKLVFLLPPQIALISLARSFSKDHLKPYIHFFPYGIALAALFLNFEIIGGGIVFNLIRGEPVGIPADPDEFNRAAVILSLYSFSALAILKHYSNHPLYFLVILFPLTTALLMTESQSAQLSFIVGVCFLLFFPYRSKVAWHGLTFLILILTAAAPFFISTVYDYYAHAIQDMPMMTRAYAGHRLEIWDYVSRYALREPLHGFGIEATRAITDFDSGRIFKDNNTTLHPHNFVLQIWIEFGLTGILTAMYFIYALFSKMRDHFTPARQKIILPTVMAAMVPGAAAFGIWQGWWIALLFHLAAMCLIACKFTDKSALSSER